MIGQHTKRSMPFRTKVRRFIDKLQANTLSSDERVDLVALLQTHTTDHPVLVKTLDEEPIFPLVARDVTADGLVDAWCEAQIEYRLTNQITEPANKIAEARDIAREMRAYPNRKRPD